jgi:HEPN domain-containing protein
MPLLQVYRAFNLMANLPSIAASWVDVDNAVRNIIDRSHHYGTSRFSSHLAAEKVLKAFIRAHGAVPPTKGPHAHDLMHLRGIAVQREHG